MAQQNEQQGAPRPRGNYLVQAWLVLALALGFGAALAAVQVAWGPVIERNKADDARKRIPAILLGPMSEAQAGAELKKLSIAQETVEVSVAGGGKTAYTVYRVARQADGALVGWVVRGRGSGYADTIELLVGLDADGRRITGMDVLAQNETPGLGNRIQKAKWRRQFAGREADHPLVVVKGRAGEGNEITALSSATISSDSVVNIVNETVREIRTKLPELRRRAGAEAAE